MITINKFEQDTESQMTAYLDTLHPNVNKARFVVMFGEGHNTEINGMSNYIKKHFMRVFEENKYGDVFCTINSTNKFVHGEKKDRLAKNIYNYDTLMFDLDAKGENLSGFENQLVDEFFNYCKINQFPAPNAFSYSGSGGVHLYYTIIPCYPGLGKAIKALKYIMAEKIVHFLDDYRDAYGMDYIVDTKVFDEMRMDRVPGTMNPKTGRMCEFFTTNVERYTFRLLLNYNGDIDLVNWDTVLKAAKNNYYYGKNKHTKIVLSACTKKKVQIKGKKNPNIKEKSLNPMLRRRIEGFFKLADMGYDFRGARETSCFALRQICRNCGIEREEELELLHKLNDCFYQPLNESFLIKHTDSPRQYKFSNEVLAANLGLDVTDELFVKAFQAKPKLVKEYGFNKPTLGKAKVYLAVAKELSLDINTTIKQIVKRTGFTLDQVKKSVAVLRHDPEGLAKWNHSTLDDYDFIIEYFKTHSQNARSRSKKEDKKSTVRNTNDDLVILVKDKIIPSIGKKIVISKEILESTPIKYAVTLRCEKLMSYFVMLKKESSSFTDRDPHHKRVKGLIGMCYVLVGALYSAGSHPNGFSFFVSELNLPAYTSRVISFGYIDYSYDFIRSHCEKYLGDNDIESAAVPNTIPMYNGKIEEFPEYKPSYAFKFSPFVIFNHHYGIWNDNDRIMDYVPITYAEYYNKTHDLLNSYRMHRNNYKKFSSIWNVEMANRSVMYARELLNKIDKCEAEYNYEMENDPINKKYFSEFDPYKINRELTAWFIKNAA